jgi:hypothetical protein
MPISRICGLIINPLGKPKKNVEVSKEEAAEIVNFKNNAKEMCNAIKAAIDNLILHVVNLKIEEYPGGNFACGVELKASPEFAAENAVARFLSKIYKIEEVENFLYFILYLFSIFEKDR